MHLWVPRAGQTLAEPVLYSRCWLRGSARSPPEHPPRTPPPHPPRKPLGTVAASGYAAKPLPRKLVAGTAVLPSPWHGTARHSQRPASPPRVGEGDGSDDDDDDDGEAWRGWVPSRALSPLIGVSELEPAAGRDASGLRAHRAPPSLSPAAPPARPASTKDAEPASGSLPSTQPATAAGSLMDLPTAGEKLEHCTKARPRPNRRHKQPPSKPNVRGVDGWQGWGGRILCLFFFLSFFSQLGEFLQSVFVARQENEMHGAGAGLLFPHFSHCRSPLGGGGQPKRMGWGLGQGGEAEKSSIPFPAACWETPSGGSWWRGSGE